MSTDLSASTPSPPQRTRRVIAATAAALALVVGGTVALGAHRTTNSSSTLAADRSAAVAAGLKRTDLPSTWQLDVPSTAPLAGLLGVNAGAKPTREDQAMTATITRDFQDCMQVSEVADRFFGRAGVQPRVQVPSAPFSLSGITSTIEVGTATQRYGSATDVARDRRQARSPRFATCMSQAMGRFLAAAGGPSALVADPVVVPQELVAPLGVFVTGGTATVSYPTAGGAVPIEVGTTLLMSGRDEQYLYTFSSSGTFPSALRQGLVDALGARLVQRSAVAA